MSDSKQSSRRCPICSAEIPEGAGHTHGQGTPEVNKRFWKDAAEVLPQIPPRTREPILFVTEMVDGSLASRMVMGFKSLGEVIPCVLVDLPKAIDYLPSLIDVPNARCCVGCRDEIPEGVYHGCNFKQKADK